MASEVTLQCQEVVKCGLCQEPVSFYCRQCVVNLCDSCVPSHLRVKTEFGHDVVDIACKAEKDTCFCDTHPKHNCSAYCETCDATICILCVSLRHKSHKITELSGNIELYKCFSREKNRLRSIKHKLETVLNHTNKVLSSSSIYQTRKDEVTFRGKELIDLIEKRVKTLHIELDDLKKDYKAALNKQKKEIEEEIEKINEITRKATKLQKSNDIAEMRLHKNVLEKQGAITEISQYTFPIFCASKIDVNDLLTYFGYIEQIQKRNILLSQMKMESDVAFDRKILDVPLVSCIIDSGFPYDEKHKGRLYGMAISGDKIWMGGYGQQLKLFNLHGNLLRSVKITWHGLYICVHNTHLVFSDILKKTVKKIADDDTILTLFTTGEWIPHGITGSASGDLLVCLRKDKQSKVVRYGSDCTVLQEIQYDSLCQPLYQFAWYIAENVNGDIIVTDFKKKMVIAVDDLGIFRYSYSGKKRSSDLTSVATNSVGHVIITDFEGSLIHMLDRNGSFIRYITPAGVVIEHPRAVCMINDIKMIVGECFTGLAKTIKIMEE